MQFRPDSVQPVDTREHTTPGAHFWWVPLMAAAAAVPAFAALVLMGSASFALIIGLITAGVVGLAAVLI